MTKAELVSVIAKDTKMTAKEVLKVVESMTKTVKKAVVGGESVMLRGFGTFGIVVQAEKYARDIGRGTAILIPERNKPVFIPSKEFVDGVRGE